MASPSLTSLFPEADSPPAGPWAGDLEVAARAALRGGAAAMTHYGEDDLAVRDKGTDDPVTAADHAANRAILEVLREARPDDPVLSEESGPPDAGELGGPATAEASRGADESRGPAEAPAPAGAPGPTRRDDSGRRLWVVDPLDGTKEFLARNGEFSVMVGLAVDGAARLGAVYQPDPDLLFLGIIGLGAWRVASAQQSPAGTPLAVREEPGVPLRFVRSRSHPDERLRRLEEALAPVRIVKSGSVGIKCALIAAGAADLYVHPVPYLKEWDTCAPEAVLRGAGGRVTDCAGEALAYGKPRPRQPRGIFAADPETWSRAAPTVRDVTSELVRGAG